jgi:hypothetical protein
LSLIKILGRHQTQVHQRKRVSLLRRCPLARQYLDALSIGGLAEVEVYACGPHPMLEAVAVLAKEYALPCQVSLEEYMACGVGGCAGCVVEVQTDNGDQNGVVPHQLLVVHQRRSWFC